MTRHEWLKQIARRFIGRGVSRFGLQLGVMLALGTSGAFAAENGTNLPWEGPLTTLVTSLTGPVAYAISVIAIVALGATLAFAGGEMGETMKRLQSESPMLCAPTAMTSGAMTSFRRTVPTQTSSRSG